MQTSHHRGKFVRRIPNFDSFGGCITTFLPPIGLNVKFGVIRAMGKTHLWPNVSKLTTLCSANGTAMVSVVCLSVVCDVRAPYSDE